MIDQGKTIKGLELCRYDPDPGMPLKSEVSCDICPYWDDTYGCRMNDMFNDAIALLKAQEPVRPVKRSFTVSGADEYLSTPPITVCGACGEWLLSAAPRAKYCPNCGRAVKWE